MKRFILLFAILSISLIANEYKVNSFLHLGSIEIPVPNENADYAKLLEYQHFDKSNWNPSEKDEFILSASKSLKWNKLNTSEININNDSKNSRLDYYAFFIKTNRFSDIKIKCITNSFVSLIINNEVKTANKSNSKVDTITSKLSLESGAHLVIVKVLTPSNKETNISFIVDSEYEIETTTDNNRFTTVEDLLNNPKISNVDISFDGSLAMIKISKRSSDRKSSDNYIEIFDLKNNKVSADFSGGMKISSAEWHPSKNIIAYQISGSNGTSIWMYDFNNRTNKLFVENIKDLGGTTWSPNGEFLIYSVSENYKEDESGLKKYTSINDRWPYNKNKSRLYKLDYPSGFSYQLIFDEDSPSLNSISYDGNFIIYSVNKVDLKNRPYSKNSYYKLNLNDLTKDSLFTLGWSGAAKISPNGNDILITAGPSAFDGAGLNLKEDLIPNEYDTQAFIYNLDSKTVKAITKDFNPQVNNAEWIDNNNLNFQVTDESYTRIYKYNISSKTFNKVEIPQEDIDKIDFSNDYSVAVYSGSSSNEHTKVYSYNFNSGKSLLISDVDPKYKNIQLGDVKDWDFTSSKGRKIKGRVYYPPNFDESKKYPVIVNYYGGTSPTTREFEGRYPKNIWAANGYLVCVLQPSGATGFGQTFSAYHVNDWGTTTADEIIEGTKKFLSEHEYADSKKVGCIGASYGGFMTMTLLTKTDIFAAAISHAGISTLTSYWGEGYWGYSYSAIATADSFPWNRKDIYIDKSPIYNADKINSPLLLLHGKSDTNVPVGESLTMFTALKLLGKDVEFVQVDGQDHWIMDYDKRMKWTKTIIAYYDRFLKDQPEWWNNLYPEKITD